MAELMEWSKFLEWLSNPTAIPIAVGIMLSVITEYVPAYGRLAPRWKRAVFFGVNLIIPNVAALLGVLTLDWSPLFFETFWPAIVAGVFAFGSGTMVHLRKLPAVTSRAGFPPGKAHRPKHR